MKKLINNKLTKYFALFLFSFLGIEIIFRLIEKMDILSWSFLRIFLGHIILSLFLANICNMIKNKYSRIIAEVIILIATIYGIAQLGFDSFIGVYMSINTSSQLGAVKDYIIDFIAAFNNIYYLLVIPFILSIIYNVFLLNKDKQVKFKVKSSARRNVAIQMIASCLVGVVLVLCYDKSLTAKFMQNNMQTLSTLELFKYPSVPSVAVQNFGIIGYGLDDIKTVFINNDEEINTNYNEEPTEEKEENNQIFKTDDTNWQNIIDNEKNQNLNKINNYLINKEKTYNNEYTGLFEGKNVIVLMLESIGEVIINEEYYPNFYKMYTEGMSFVNHYSPRNSCATGNNEFSGMTSLYSIYNTCTANIYKGNVYEQSIYGLFNNAGYHTVGMHDYTEAYYFRSTIHKNMGADAYYGVEKLKIPYRNEYKNWASDEDFANAAMDIILNNEEYSDKPFMLWMTTVSAHQPYADSIEGNKYYSLFDDTNYSSNLKHYMSKVKITDNALGILMDRLEEAGILDDTIFVMYGDHYPYGLPLSTLNQVLDYDLENYENERTPFAIYGTGIEKTVITKYTSYINLLPTIANLFGLEYDPRYYMGNDVLSDDYESMVVFADGSWKNEEVYYNAKTSKIEYYVEDSIYDLDKIKEINQKITTDIMMSSAIIKNDYFKYLTSSLKTEENKKNLEVEIEIEEE